MNFSQNLQWFCTKKASNQVWPWVCSLNFQKLLGKSLYYFYVSPTVLQSLYISMYFFQLNFLRILLWFCTKKGIVFQIFTYVCIFNWIFLFLWISCRICNDFAQKRHPIRSDLEVSRWTSKIVCWKPQCIVELSSPMFSIGRSGSKGKILQICYFAVWVLKSILILRVYSYISKDNFFDFLYIVAPALKKWLTKKRVKIG